MYPKKTFYIFTLGCKLNQYESEAVSHILSSNGYEYADNPSTAEIIIINTCTVTSKADCKSRNLIRKSKRLNPDCIIIVTGCMVEKDMTSLERIHEVDIIITNKDKDKIIYALNEYYEEASAGALVFKSPLDGSFNFKLGILSRHARAFLKIQDGCDNYCSYCKIPYVRGKSRSKNVDDIFSDIKNYINNGYEEIVLTGINIGSYKYGSINFMELLRMILDKFNNIRIRISSLEPEFITEEFLDIFRNPKICPHLHIPMQSASNKILTSMKRKYSIEEYIEKIHSIRRINKYTFISTDLIIGFPGETENDFNNIVKNITELRLSFIHLFGFSPRKETMAFNYKPKIPERIRDERMNHLKDIIKMHNLEYRKNFIGRTLNIVVERKNNGFYTGKSENYIDINVKTDEKLIQKKIYKVILKKIDGNLNHAELIF